MDVKGISLSTTCSLDVHWASLSPPPTPALQYGHAGCIQFHSQQNGLAVRIPFHQHQYGRAVCTLFYMPECRTVRYRNEQQSWCRNHSGTGIRVPSPVPECSRTGLRYRMPDGTPMPAASTLMPMPSYVSFPVSPLIFKKALEREPEPFIGICNKYTIGW